MIAPSFLPKIRRCSRMIFSLFPLLAFQGMMAGAISAIPTLDEMAGDWIPMKDVVNPPAVHNFHDMLIVDYYLTSFACSPGGEIIPWNKVKKIYPPVNNPNGKSQNT